MIELIILFIIGLIAAHYALQFTNVQSDAGKIGK